MSQASPSPSVGVVVATVTHDSEEHIECWWQALCALRCPSGTHLRVVVVDCASRDGSVERLRSLPRSQESPELTIIPLPENEGFTGGMNRACSEVSAADRWLFSLNPDARPAANALEFLCAAFDRYQRAPGSQFDQALRVGAVTGRLARPVSGSREPTQGTVSEAVSEEVSEEVRAAGEERARSSANVGVLDACGMIWTRSWRHLDRGSDQPDDGRYCDPAEVFAGTGAATLYSIEALRDVAHTGGEIFDRSFHSFREDAELGLRLQRRGWSTLYEPAARIEHRRHNLPSRRSAMSQFINYHSLKNRFLLRILHQSPSNVMITLPALLRDVAIVPYVILRERSSAGAFSWLWRHRAELLHRRRLLSERQTVTDDRVNRWFRQNTEPLVARSNAPAKATEASSSASSSASTSASTSASSSVDSRPGSRAQSVGDP